MDEIILKALDKIVGSDVVQKMLQKYGVDEEFLYLLPITFAELEVSARTLHGCIYLNERLQDEPEEVDPYLVHELTHVFQQCFGDEPTVGSGDSDDYLSNPFEIEGFQNQIEYIANEDGKEEASDYTNQVLEHHEYEGEERKEKKDELMAKASKPVQLSLFDAAPKEDKPKSSKKVTVEEMKQWLKDFDEGKLPPKEPRGMVHEKLDSKSVKWRLKRLEELLRAIG